MNPTNEITVYSNGIVNFKRLVEKDDSEISIPVKTNYVGDVISTLILGGSAQFKKSPAFINESDSTLSIDTSSAFVSLMQDLSGATGLLSLSLAEEAVVVSVVGIEELNRGEQGTDIYLVYNEEGRIKKTNIKNIESFEIQDEIYKAEFNKSFVASRESIKKDSKFVKFEVYVPEDATGQSYYQYAVPAAAWKISYRIIERQGKSVLQAYAIVENNTEEDWDDVKVHVVSGSPITFSTDISKTRIPSRSHVNLVEDQTQRPSELQSMGVSTLAKCPSSINIGAETARSLTASAAMDDRCVEAASYGVDSNDNLAVQDVGDFTKFSSGETMSIPAGSSVEFPVFSQDIELNRTVFYSDSSINSGVSFVNDTGFSLGRGVCAVYTEETDGLTYSGNCIIPDVKKDEEVAVVFSTETFVSVRDDYVHEDAELTKILFDDGIVTQWQRNTMKTVYHISNRADDTRRVQFDYFKQLVGDQTEFTVKAVTASGEELNVMTSSRDNTMRVSLEVAGEDVEVSVTRVSLTKLDHRLSVGNIDRVCDRNMLVGTGVSDSKEFQQIVSLNREITTLVRAKQENNNMISQLTASQSRIRENIAAMPDSDDFKTKLVTSETKIDEFEVKSAENDRKIEKNTAELDKLIREFKHSWELDVS